MKKVPTLFERDWNGDKSRVTPQVHAGCEWVLAGEGIPTRKLDGTSCLIRNGALYRRRELKRGEPQPPLFEMADYDEETGKTVGWVPVEPSNPSDKYHAEAFESMKVSRAGWSTTEDLTPEGTYELVGPKVQGNPEHWPNHALVKHSDFILKEGMEDAPRTFDGLKEWLAEKDIEGLVFHHPDGRMAKIKLRDFGLKHKQTQ